MIKSKLLNKTVSVYSVTQSMDGSGDGSNTETLVGTIAMRITSNKPTNFYGRDFGTVVSSTNIGFTNPFTTVTIKNGYIVKDGSNKYKVVFVDPTPGGEINHHCEILMNLVQE